MASLIENLITGLNEEYAVYEKLLSVSMEKTSAIVANDLDRLKETTDKEQYFADIVASLERTRRETIKNIAGVLGKNDQDIKITEIIGFLDGQPEFRDPLAEINEKLSRLLKKLKEVNDHNQNLITDALSMIEYNINLIQNIDRAPETAEYSKEMFKRSGAYPGDMTGNTGNFDTKQ